MALGLNLLAKYVESAIRERAGNPDLEPSNALRERAVREFDSQKPAVSSILETATAGLTDNFLSRLAEDLDGLSIASRQQIISVQRPRGKLFTRDSLLAKPLARLARRPLQRPVTTGFPHPATGRGRRLRPLRAATAVV